MPSAAARQLYEDQIPSFMSVFDLHAESMASREAVTMVDGNLNSLVSQLTSASKPPSSYAPCLKNSQPQSSASSSLRSGPVSSDTSHKHNESTSTQASESADSSPTTTLSTTDSSPLSDPSPSSPTSPLDYAPTLIPLNSFPTTSFGAQSPDATGGGSNTLTVNSAASPGSPSGRPMTSPSPRRPRNTKGLGLSIPSPFQSPNPNKPLTLVSEPTSPSFAATNGLAIKPKPSLLTLNTTTLELAPPSDGLDALKSPSMMQRRALKHSTSSPHMLSSLKSCTFGPTGGMNFPKVLERNESGLSEMLRPLKSGVKATFDTVIREEDSPIKTQMANRAIFDQEPYAEQENNEDQKSPGYPNGPIAIYEDNVYLYLEPTAEEASKFDLVINVAREVHNPFKMLDVEAQNTEAAPLDTEKNMPKTAATADSFMTAYEVLPGANNDGSSETPTTPRATSSSSSSLPSSSSQPEYIHMLWDHNSNIALDLMELCEKVEQTTKEGKKVLIHCQQGASRSASLIIAYGMYLNPDLSVNDAYYAAQAKSRWISPNMKLMYCLQDFQKEVTKRRANAGKRSGRTPSTHYKLALCVDETASVSPQEPRTAPLVGSHDIPLSPTGDDSLSGRPRGNSTPVRPSMPLGITSAPARFGWSREDNNTPPPESNYESLNAVSMAPPPVFAPFKPPPSPGFSSGFPSDLPMHHSEHAPKFQFSNLPFRSHNHDGASPAKTAAASTAAAPAQLWSDATPVERTVTIFGTSPLESTLLSPRAETMTRNPLHDTLESTEPVPGFSSVRLVEIPPTPTDVPFSPRTSLGARDPVSSFVRPALNDDPRSPPTAGEAQITRSIDDLL